MKIQAHIRKTTKWSIWKGFMGGKERNDVIIL